MSLNNTIPIQKSKYKWILQRHKVPHICCASGPNTTIGSFDFWVSFTTNGGDFFLESDKQSVKY